MAKKPDDEYTLPISTPAAWHTKRYVKKEQR
jgi:hypothetical protein